MDGITYPAPVRPASLILIAGMLISVGLALASIKLR